MVLVTAKLIAPCRGAPARVVTGQDEPDDRDQFERHEQVEQVATPGEVDAGGQEDQYQRRVTGARAGEEALGIHQRGHGEEAGEHRQPASHGVDHVVDADHGSVDRRPVAEPVDDGLVGGLVRARRPALSVAAAAPSRFRPPAQVAVGAGQHGGRAQGYCDGQRDDGVRRGDRAHHGNR